MTWCSVDSCRKPMRYTTLGVCQMHYFRLRRNGTLDVKPKRNSGGSK